MCVCFVTSPPPPGSHWMQHFCSSSCTLNFPGMHRVPSCSSFSPTCLSGPSSCRSPVVSSSHTLESHLGNGICPFYSVLFVFLWFILFARDNGVVRLERLHCWLVSSIAHVVWREGSPCDLPGSSVFSMSCGHWFAGIEVWQSPVTVATLSSSTFICCILGGLYKILFERMFSAKICFESNGLHCLNL